MTGQAAAAIQTPRADGTADAARFSRRGTCPAPGADADRRRPLIQLNPVTSGISPTQLIGSGIGRTPRQWRGRGDGARQPADPRLGEGSAARLARS